jgi:hypothetical protein
VRVQGGEAVTDEIQWPKGKYYSCDDSDEVLSHEEPWEAIEEFLQGFIDHTMTPEQVEEAIGDVAVTVTGYDPMPVSDAQIEIWADGLYESLAEAFGEEHGNPDDALDDLLCADADKIMLEAVTKIIRSTRAWSCEAQGSIDLSGEQVLALARKERPDWFERAKP